MPWDEPRSTAVVVPTPEVEPIAGELYRTHAEAGREGMRPHITLLVPFVPAPLLDAGVEARLRRVLGSSEPFDYILARLERWPEGVLFLAPQPSEPFVELVHALMNEFPDHPPYDGVHDEVIPHATVAVSEDEALLDRIAAEVQPRLPVMCHAAEATLVERGSDLRWRARASFALGYRQFGA